MKRFVSVLLGLFLAFPTLFAQHNHRVISSVDILKSKFSGENEVCKAEQKHNTLMETDPTYVQRYQQNAQIVRDIINNPIKAAETVHTIPVVVHVLHLGEAEGTGTNITDAQINSAINNLNDCYSGAGSYVTDIGIQFQLATNSPTCTATDGIIRVNASGTSDYATNGITDANETTIKAISKWPNDQYYNIWIVSEIDNNGGGGGTQGYAYYPGAGSSKDGSVILYNSFGYDPTETLGYNLKSYTKHNATTNHELGHALNVKHTFNGDNDGASCPTNTNPTTDGDECADTPAHKRGDGDCGDTGLTCDGGDLADVVTNIMAYSSDQCQVKFSGDQKLRMRAALEGTRSSLLTSRGLDAPPTGFVAPVAATCTPTTTSPGNASGIKKTEMNGYSISSGSSGSDGGYVDNSGECAMFFEIDADEVNTLNVDVYTVNMQQLMVGIDWNDDGDFNDDNELQHTSQDIAASSTVSFNLIYPTTVPYDDYVRCRVLTDLDNAYGNALFTSLCDNPGNGQAEDYAIYVKPASGVPPVAEFSASATTTCQNVAINFTDASTESPTSWSWDFGDGNTSTLQNPSNTYLTAGTYTVTLTATNATGNDDEVKTDYITVNAVPNLSVNSSTDETCAGNDGTATVNPSAGSGSYTYDWGASSGNQTTQTATALAAANYNVTVTDAVTSCNSSTSVTVNLDCVAPPVAEFSADASSACENTAINFTDASTNIPTSWSWDFGDGNTSTLQNPSNTYLTAGTYTVTLTATNEDGNDSEIKTDYITINATPNLSSTSSTDETCIGNNGTATVNPSGGSGSYTYDWGASSGNQTTQTATALAAANYNVTVTDAVTTCNASTSVTVNYDCVLPPVADFTADLLYTCTGNTITFTDASTNSPTSWLWDFGDGITSTLQNPTHVYAVDGKYTVVLTSSNSGGNDAETKVDYIENITCPTTQLRVEDCGITVAGVEQYIYADKLKGAESYMFKYTNTTSGAEFFHERYNWVSSLIWAGTIGTNATYDVQVKVKMNGLYGDYGAVCQVSSPATIPNTQLRGADCGITVTAIEQYIFADKVIAAESYMFKYTNTISGAEFFHERSNWASSLLWANAFETGATYDVQVKVKLNGIYGDYGPVCQVSSPASNPTTQLRGADCGITLTSFAQYIYADKVVGAETYMFKYTNTSTAAEFFHERGNWVSSLDWANALDGDATYDVQVKVKIDGVYGNYGSVCQVTAPAAQTLVVNPSNDVVQKDPTADNRIADFSVSTHPNPNDGNTLFVDVSGLNESQEHVDFVLMDMYGKIVYQESYSSDASRIVKQIDFSEKLVSGIYLMNVQKGSTRVISKVFIK